MADLKSSEYWDPALPLKTKLIYIGIAAILFVIFMIPAWILYGSSSNSTRRIMLGNVFALLGIIAPAMVIFFYTNSQKKRYEAREDSFKEILIPHNRKHFIPNDYPIRMSLFGAYFTIEKPGTKHLQTGGPLVKSGAKKLTQEERKFELAYMDVDEEVENAQESVPMRHRSSSRPAGARNGNGNAPMA